MKEIYSPGTPQVDGAALEAHVQAVAEQFAQAGRILIVPPDFTRCYSMAGEITKLLYRFFAPRAEVKIIPALGTHMPMDDRERLAFFGDIPSDCFLTHRWYSDTVRLGAIPGSVTAEISGGLYREPIAVELNNCFRRAALM